jgi:hypothetical protein
LIRRFWQTMALLTALVVLYTCLSWWYLWSNHITLSQSHSLLPTITMQIPSIWNFVQPSSVSSWVAPITVFVLQVWLTGGFFGTLARINMGQHASVGSFIVDSMRAFVRLLLWYFFWDAVYLFVAETSKLSIWVGLFAAVFALIFRYFFLFGDVALVCEGQASIRQAVRTALGALANGLVPMLPFGIAFAFTTDAAMTYAGRLTAPGVLIVAIIYAVVMTWLSHMVVARYLYFSNWISRQNGVNPVDTTSQTG